MTDDMFLADKPLENKADDSLNRVSFAERIASVIASLPPRSSLVIGVHGPWGDGKTTVLNLIRAELSAKPDYIIIVEFNPWRYEDESVILTGFFQTLAERIRTQLTTSREKMAALIATFGQYVSVVHDSFTKATELAATKAQPSLEELRARLAKALADIKQRIVVFIDDVDRLDKSEAYTLFRVVKACADFPNVCYVMAFDDVAVAAAIAERFGCGGEDSGRAFLEKIIQVPLKLPPATREDLRTLCLQHVDRALTVAGIELSRRDLNEFLATFEGCISEELKTPRTVKRFVNAIMFAVPMLKGEVSTVDLLLVEALRAFFPIAYDCVRSNQDAFSGAERDHERHRNEPSRALRLITPALESMNPERQERAKHLLARLFPRLSALFGGSQYGTNWISTWTDERRVSAPDYCSRYFTYAVARNDVRESEIATLLSTAEDADEAAVHECLASLFTAGKSVGAVDRLRRLEEQIQESAVPSICMALAKLARHIPYSPLSNRFLGPSAQAAILMSHLIRRLPEGSERLTLAKRVIDVVDPLWFGSECVQWLYVTDDAEKSNRNTLTKEEVSDVLKHLASRIKARAATSEPLFSIDREMEQQLLFDWARAEGRSPVQAHLSALFDRDKENLGRFLLSIAPLAWLAGDTLYHRSELLDRNLVDIELVFDLDAFAGRVRDVFGEATQPETYSSGEQTPAQLAAQFLLLYKQRQA